MGEANETQPIILIIDDIDIQLVFYRRVFEALSNFSVITAQSIDEALRLIAQESPDLVMVDYRIGSKTGIDFARLVRSHADTADLPIMMMCVGNRELIQQQATEVGINAVMWMPYDPKEIVSTIKSLLI